MLALLEANANQRVIVAGIPLPWFYNCAGADLRSMPKRMKGHFAVQGLLFSSMSSSEPFGQLIRTQNSTAEIKAIKSREFLSYSF